MSAPARTRFITLLRDAVAAGSLVKLTLGKYRGPDASLKNAFVRLVTLKSGPHLAFVWRHDTRDVTKNLPHADGLAEIERSIGSEFLDAHLFTTSQQAQLESTTEGGAKLRTKQVGNRHDATATPHDHVKRYAIPPESAWLRALGVTNDRNQPREGMSDKFRQIQKFAELLTHLLGEAFPDSEERDAPLRVADMGSGKGYLTFAVAELLGSRALVRGIEARPALVTTCNSIAAQVGLENRLSFTAGTIQSAPLDGLDVLIALHACDTATDDALARGIETSARLLVVSPCCQKELRRQLRAAPVFQDALRHGIFQERQAEFATDALRAQLLEYAGYRTKVFEFISTEHTAKNLMIAAVKRTDDAVDREEQLRRIRAFAAFFGLHSQALARHLGVELADAAPPPPP